ncbi:pyridoxamine 5'-phosphate oxidase family protein [Acetobacter sp. DsW_063]|uniref:pyridoxamine 5'-phosphate oxidase family protein n=1 Tax=Acetobacter sp. DsW_063 TaxID=1514894 RepID=UPI000A37DCC1|nr:pyridoxamine 5'-phosphate oxidase family protein [Acetobacter sp. DsW_063]OUJ14259.1 flavin-nucleotide-binding protein [Acetobacter sp. DsW_063]
MPDTPSDTFPVTQRSRIRRAHQRGSYVRDDVYAVIDASPLCHVGYVIDGEPYVTPTIHWREGDVLYWHGSAASRFLESVVGARACVTCSLMDGYVMARSAFNHSVNYRSAMAFGVAELVDDPNHAADALRRFVENLFPGRWDSLRPMTGQELKATSVLQMTIEEATVKVRDAPPGDPQEADVPVWAGVIPMVTRLGAPVPAPELPKETPFPEELARLIASGRLR